MANMNSFIILSIRSARPKKRVKFLDSITVLQSYVLREFRHGSKHPVMEMGLLRRSYLNAYLNALSKKPVFSRGKPALRCQKYNHDCQDRRAVQTRSRFKQGDRRHDADADSRALTPGSEQSRNGFRWVQVRPQFTSRHARQFFQREHSFSRDSDATPFVYGLRRYAERLR